MKKPIAVIIADTHLDENNIETNKSIYSQACDLADSLGIDTIDHAGDVFDSRKAQTQENLASLNDIFDEIERRGKKIHIAVGNHDKTNYASERSFLIQAQHHPAVTLHEVYGKRELVNGTTLWYMSFFSDKVYLEHMEALNGFFELRKGKHVLLTHIGISGAVMNNGTVVGTHIPTSIHPDLFKSFDLTLVGHYHDFQTLAENKIRYIGASIQHNYGELLGKGATVLYDDMSTEIIPFKYPEYIKYEVDPKDLTKQDIEDLKQEKAESGNNIRIVLVGTEADVKSYNKQDLQNAGISVQLKQEDIDREELEGRVEPFDGKSLYQEFEAFCKKKGLDVAAGKKYLSEVI